MKGLATWVAIRWAPCGRRRTSGSASHEYSRLANGTRHASTITTQAIALIRRERSSSRCEKMPCSRSKPESASESRTGSRSGVVIAGFLGDGIDGGGFGGLCQIRDRFAYRCTCGPYAVIGSLAHELRARGRVLRGAPDFFQFQLALDFAAHALPAQAQPPHHRTGHARGLGELLRPEHYQRNNRQQQQ